VNVYSSLLNFPYEKNSVYLLEGDLGVHGVLCFIDAEEIAADDCLRAGSIPEFINLSEINEAGIVDIDVGHYQYLYRITNRLFVR
jgi:hypothetical protein